MFNSYVEVPEATSKYTSLAVRYFQWHDPGPDPPPRHQAIIDNPRFAVFHRWKSCNCLGKKAKQNMAATSCWRGKCFTQLVTRIGG